MRYAVMMLAVLYIQVVFRVFSRLFVTAFVVTDKQRLRSSSLNTAQISIGIHLISHLKSQFSIGITLISQIPTLNWYHSYISNLNSQLVSSHMQEIC